jgi:DNA-binding MarR family transcriptional regulator
MIGAGLIGGTAAYVARPLADQPADPKGDPAAEESVSVGVGGAGRFLLLGVVAASIIPLFLSLTDSRLLETILKGGRGVQALEGYLVLIGLCLIAAFSSRAFIATVQQQLFRRMEKVEEKAADAKSTAADAKNVADDAKETALDAKATSSDLSREAELADEKTARSQPEAQSSPRLSEAVGDSSIILDADERAALRALTKRTHRTMSGVAEDSQISRSRISELLERLAQRGLAEPTTSPNTGGLRWRITPRGISALAGLS